jgi:hypothetical protein
MPSLAAQDDQAYQIGQSQNSAYYDENNLDGDPFLLDGISNQRHDEDKHTREKATPARKELTLHSVCLYS